MVEHKRKLENKIFLIQQKLLQNEACMSNTEAREVPRDGLGVMKEVSWKEVKFWKRVEERSGDRVEQGESGISKNKVERQDDKRDREKLE